MTGVPDTPVFGSFRGYQLFTALHALHAEAAIIGNHRRHGHLAHLALRTDEVVTMANEIVAVDPPPIKFSFIGQSRRPQAKSRGRMRCPPVLFEAARERPRGIWIFGARFD
jgi:hypothetical protein